MLHLVSDYSHIITNSISCLLHQTLHTFKSRDSNNKLNYNNILTGHLIFDLFSNNSAS